MWTITGHPSSAELGYPLGKSWKGKGKKNQSSSYGCWYPSSWHHADYILSCPDWPSVSCSSKWPPSLFPPALVGKFSHVIHLITNYINLVFFMFKVLDWDDINSLLFQDFVGLLLALLCRNEIKLFQKWRKLVDEREKQAVMIPLVTSCTGTNALYFRPRIWTHCWRLTSQLVWTAHKQKNNWLEEQFTFLYINSA